MKIIFIQFFILQLSYITSLIKEIEVEIDDNLNIIKLNDNIYSAKSPGHINIIENFKIIRNPKFISLENLQNQENLEITSILSELPKEEPHDLSPALMWTYIIVIILLSTFSGIMSGLTVGYLSIDDLVLELKAQNGTDEEKLFASKVLPVLADRHQLLVTLLIWNAGCLESLPIFLSFLVNEFFSIVISVFLVLMVGEIIPMSVATGPDQMKITSTFAGLARFLIIITYPLCWPIGKLLDCILGTHSKSRFVNQDLIALIELHTVNELRKHNIIKNEKFDEKIVKQIENNNNNNNPTKHVQSANDLNSKNKMKQSFVSNFGNNDLGLENDQAHIMISALEIGQVKARDIMIRTEDSYMLDYNGSINKQIVDEISLHGYSRIPIYKNGNKHFLTGILRTKYLIGKLSRINDNEVKIFRELNLKLSKPIIISPELSLINLLREFRKGRSHMAFVTNNVENFQKILGLDENNSEVSHASKFSAVFNNEHEQSVEILGLVTLKDVIERMLKLEIMDEEDYLKLKKKTKQLQKNKNLISRKIALDIADKIVLDEEMKKKYLIDNTKIPTHANVNKSVFPFDRMHLNNSNNISSPRRFTKDLKRKVEDDSNIRLSEPIQHKLSFTSDVGNSSGNFIKHPLEESKEPFLSKKKNSL